MAIERFKPSETITANEYLTEVYQKTLQQMLRREDTDIIAAFIDQDVPKWFVLWNTGGEGGLVEDFSWGKTKLEHGFIAETPDRYLGVALNTAPRESYTYPFATRQLEFGVVTKEEFKRTMRIKAGRTALLNYKQGQSLEERRENAERLAAERLAAEKTKPVTTADLRTIVYYRGNPGSFGRDMYDRLTMYDPLGYPFESLHAYDKQGELLSREGIDKGLNKILRLSDLQPKI